MASPKPYDHVPMNRVAGMRMERNQIPRDRARYHLNADRSLVLIVIISIAQAIRQDRASMSAPVVTPSASNRDSVDSKSRMSSVACSRGSH